MDTTLRDGEQTSGVSFVPHEKLMIARLLLEDLKVDRIEVASARVSDGEFNAVKMICDWAARRGLLQRVEVLGFVDGKMSVDWIHDAGGQVINLLSKGSEKHCRYQLKKTLEEHLADIRNTVDYAHERGLEVNLYLEDWSNGIKDSPDYVFGLVDGLRDIGIRRFMLPDTLGILNPLQVIEFMRKMKKRYPDLHFDFHAHNDYDLAVANVFEAVKAGIHGIHLTINGLGERAGNAPLEEVVLGLKKLYDIESGISLASFPDIAALVAQASGRAIPWQKSVVGAGAFTHEAGIHVDGLLKHPDNYQGFDPMDVGRSHRIVLGKHSGPRAVQVVYAGLGISLGEVEAAALLGHIRRFVAAHKHSPDVADLHTLLASARSHRHV